MKNTMKIKSLLSFFVPAAMMSLMVASCSDYDNGYDTNAIKFNEEFRKAYGDIDPEQDWNLAERGTVTVSTMKESEVKIYALRGNEYIIVGDFEGVIGTQMLDFDMVEGTTRIIVTDGVTAEQIVPGGAVTFGGTRAIYWDPNDANGDGVKVTKINGSVTIKGKNYPQYKEITKTGVDAMQEVIPEIGHRTTYTNLNKVTHDFSYVSNGEFVIYPYFWDTSSDNTIGVYYTDANGVYHEVDIYQNKNEGIEVRGEEMVDAQLNQARLDGEVSYSGHISKRFYSSGGLQAEYFQDYAALIYIPTYGIQLYNLGLPNDISSYTKLVVNAELKNGTPNYRVIIYPRNADGSLNRDGGKTFVITSSNTDYVIDLTSSEFNGFPLNNCEIRLSGGNAANPEPVTIQGMEGCCGDIQFKKVSLVKPSSNYTQFSGQDCNDIITGGKSGRGQGIVVSIPEGTKFGMYLKKHDSVVGDCTFYSESSKNTDVVKHGRGIKDYGNGYVDWDVADSKPSYASSFYVGDQMFLGFEDWPNNTAVWDGGDFDLNDIVLAFDGSTPTIINEEADSWLLVCEDLGGSFDTDYNDVIFRVEHVAGKATAKVTAMAAGGTLASYIFFNDPTKNAPSNTQNVVVGEIHQMFNVEPQKSGAYSPINVSRSRYEKQGNTVTIPVSPNWSIAYNVDATDYNYYDLNNKNEKGVNMGGFYVRTLADYTNAPTSSPVSANDPVFYSSKSSVIAAPKKGDAPYIICLPYTYTKVESGKVNTYVWAWPKELCTICSAAYDQDGKFKGSETGGGAYLNFAAWVSDADGRGAYINNKDWYKYKNPDGITVEELRLSSQGVNSNIPQPSQLGNKGSMQIHRGEVPNFADNLTNATLSTGAITYHLDSENGTVWSGGSLWNGGNRTVYVTQAADAYYDAGSTSFTLTVLQDPSNLSVRDGAAKVGDNVDLMSFMTTGSTGKITYRILNPDASDYVVQGNTEISRNGDGKFVAYFRPERPGRLKIVISQAADNNYLASEEKTYYITVNEDGGGSSVYIDNTAQSSYAFTVESGSSNGTYTIKYGGKEIAANVTSIQFSWSEYSGGSYGTITCRSNNYTIQKQINTGTSTSGLCGNLDANDLAKCIDEGGGLIVFDQSGSATFKLKVE